MPAIAIRDFEVAPGEKRFEALTCGEWADGTPVRLPVAVANGDAEGPGLLVLACLHGDEVVGTEAARRLMAELEPSTMQGSVVAVFAANVPAFLLGSRVNSLENPAGWNDLKKLLRTAQPTGSLTERLASAIRDELLPHCDYVVDLHSSAQGSTNYPRAIVAGDYLDVDAELRRKIDLLAHACDFEYVFKPKGTRWKGMYFEPSHPFEQEHGKAGIVLETGYAPTMEGADKLVSGMRNILTEIGVLKGSFERSKPVTFIERLLATRANRGGMWLAKAGLGDKVSEGDLLGEIRDFADNLKEEVRAPEAGIVIKVATTATISTGVRTHVLGVPYS